MLSDPSASNGQETGEPEEKTKDQLVDDLKRDILDTATFLFARRSELIL